MKSKPQTPPTSAKPAVDVPDEVQEDVAKEEDAERIFARPDGYHWVALDGHQEFGPFETYEEALADMQAPPDDESGLGEAPTLQEAEQEIGIADWTDPETGEPAEGQSPPHLEEE